MDGRPYGETETGGVMCSIIIGKPWF